MPKKAKYSTIFVRRSPDEVVHIKTFFCKNLVPRYLSTHRHLNGLDYASALDLLDVAEGDEKKALDIQTSSILKYPRIR